MPSTLRPILRACIPWLLLALSLGVGTQIGLAGAGLLSHPGSLQVHRDLAPWLNGLALATLAAALAARDLPVALGSGATLVLLLLQGPFIRSLGFTRALHAIDALLAFAICLLLLRERLPFRRSPAP